MRPRLRLRRWGAVARRLFCPLGLSCLLCLLAAGCRPAAAPRTKVKTDPLRWARCVTWVVRDSVTHLTVYPAWKGDPSPLRYALIPRGAAGVAPGEIALPVPARRIVCLASVHAGYLAALGDEASIVAVGAAGDVYDSALRAAVRAGRVAAVGSGSQLNAEAVLALHPDLVLANAVDAADYAALQRLQAAGIPVCVTAEWMEDHPLARAEWLRVFGRLVGRGGRADSLFAAEAAAYLSLARRGAEEKNRPTVIVGAPFRDTWFVPGGRSFMARFLSDAGADYLWQHDTTAGGVPLSLEAVLARGRNAAFWLEPGNWRTLQDGRRQDARLAVFSAFRRGAVYNNDARTAPAGGNDFWESAPVYPHRVLRDLLAIFHPADFPGPLFYYRRLPAGDAHHP